MNILLDPLWNVGLTIAGFIVAIIGLIESYILFVLQKNRKALSLSIASVQPLTRRTRATELLVAIHNSGNIPILPSDFVRPIIFDFGSARIAKAEVVATNPNNVRPEIKEIENTVMIEPVLLNSNDMIVIKFLLNHMSGVCNIDARIVGISVINIVRNNFVEDYDTSKQIVRFMDRNGMRKVLFRSIVNVGIGLVVSLLTLSFAIIIATSSQTGSQVGISLIIFFRTIIIATILWAIYNIFRIGIRISLLSD